MNKCLNCNTEFLGNYCNNCGQKKTEAVVTTKIVFVDFIQSVFLFDSSLYKTVIGLLFRPGNFVKSFLEGKRKRYLPPFQLFLLFMTIYLLVLNFFGDSYFAFIDSGLQFNGDNIDKDLLIESLVRINLNILYFILIPIITFFIHILYKKIKFNFAEILLFSVYIIGILFLLSSLVILIGQINPKIFSLKILIGLGYFSFAIVQFTNSKSFFGVFKALLTIALSYLVFAITILVIVSFYVFINYA